MAGHTGQWLDPPGLRRGRLSAARRAPSRALTAAAAAAAAAQVIVNVMTPAARDFYDLEGLWRHGEPIPMDHIVGQRPAGFGAEAEPAPADAGADEGWGSFDPFSKVGFPIVHPPPPPPPPLAYATPVRRVGPRREGRRGRAGEWGGGGLHWPRRRPRGRPAPPVCSAAPLSLCPPA